MTAPAFCPKYGNILAKISIFFKFLKQYCNIYLGDFAVSSLYLLQAGGALCSSNKLGSWLIFMQLLLKFYVAFPRGNENSEKIFIIEGVIFYALFLGDGGLHF